METRGCMKAESFCLFDAFEPFHVFCFLFFRGGLEIWVGGAGAVLAVLGRV